MDDDRLLDDYRALSDRNRWRQIERQGDYFIVEGRFAFEVLLDSPYPIRSILVSEPKAEIVRALLAARATAGPAGGSTAPADDAGRRVPVVVRPAPEVAAVTGFKFHRGVLAAADRLPLRPVGELTAGVRLLAVLEGLNDHENLGALFRNAAAFGVGAVLLDRTTADPLYRRSVRVSAGQVLRVPWTRFDGDVTDGLADLHDRGFTVVALTPAAAAEPIEALAGDPPPRLALLLGAEGPGLSTDALAVADRRVRIPIVPTVDSLNVATAAAIAFHRLSTAGAG